MRAPPCATPSATWRKRWQVPPPRRAAVAGGAARVAAASCARVTSATRAASAAEAALAADCCSVEFLEAATHQVESRRGTVQRGGRIDHAARCGQAPGRQFAVRGSQQGGNQIFTRGAHSRIAGTHLFGGAEMREGAVGGRIQQRAATQAFAPIWSSAPRICAWRVSFAARSEASAFSATAPSRCASSGTPRRELLGASPAAPRLPRRLRSATGHQGLFGATMPYSSAIKAAARGWAGRLS